jgi:Domain of unknown function (DUF4936)
MSAEAQSKPPLPARLHDCDSRAPELFIYYRVNARRATEARSKVLEWQRELGAAQPALHCRLLMRPVEREGLQTWMETYAIADPAHGVDVDALHKRIEQGPPGMQSWIVGERHVEVFIPCAW